MRVSPESVKAVAHEVFDYDLADDAAVAVARILGAMTSGLARLELPRGLQPPFGYPILMAEAQRLRQLT